VEGTGQEEPRNYKAKEQEREKETGRTEVETSVDDDTDDGGKESSVETGDSVRLEGLPVDVDETVELSGSADLGRLVVVGESGSGKVERVDEEEGGRSGGSTGGDVSGKLRGREGREAYWVSLVRGGERKGRIGKGRKWKRESEDREEGKEGEDKEKTSTDPLPVSLVLLETEERLEVVLEGKVQRLGREVSDDVGGVSSPESSHTLVGVGSLEAVANAGVGSSKSTLLDPEQGYSRGTVVRKSRR
jgi:hypothetical protein